MILAMILAMILTEKLINRNILYCSEKDLSV